MFKIISKILVVLTKVTVPVYFAGALFNCTDEIQKPAITYSIDTLPNKSIALRGALIDGKKFGIWNEYDPSTGRLESVSCFVDDTLNGPYIFYGHESYIFTVGSYKNNQQDGEWTDYYRYPNLIAAKNHYKGGKKTGIWEYYDEKARLELKLKYGVNEKEEILIDNRIPLTN